LKFMPCCYSVTTAGAITLSRKKLTPKDQLFLRILTMVIVRLTEIDVHTYGELS
jgi:hypothetical protein